MQRSTEDPHQANFIYCTLCKFFKKFFYSNDENSLMKLCCIDSQVKYYKISNDYFNGDIYCYDCDDIIVKNNKNEKLLLSLRFILSKYSLEEYIWIIYHIVIRHDYIYYELKFGDKLILYDSLKTELFKFFNNIC